LSSRPETRFVAVGAGIYAVVLAATVGAGLAWPRLAVPWLGARPILELASGVVAGAAIVFGSWRLIDRWTPMRRLAEMLAEAVGRIGPVAALVLAASAGLAEEAVFRGSLWTLVALSWGDAAALAVTTAAFGAVHGLFVRRMRAWGTFALAAGLVLGALRWGSGGILAPVVAHVVIDAINLPRLARFGASDPASGEAGHGEEQQA